MTSSPTTTSKPPRCTCVHCGGIAYQVDNAPDLFLCETCGQYTRKAALRDQDPRIQRPHLRRQSKPL